MAVLSLFLLTGLFTAEATLLDGTNTVLIAVSDTLRSQVAYHTPGNETQGIAVLKK